MFHISQTSIDNLNGSILIRAQSTYPHMLELTPIKRDFRVSPNGKHTLMFDLVNLALVQYYVALPFALDSVVVAFKEFTPATCCRGLPSSDNQPC